MKIRNGFVSNSSSASFVIYFYSTLPDNELIDKMAASSPWVKIHTEVDGDSFRAYFGDDILIKSNEEYRLTVSTIMFNDWTDINLYNFIRAINEKMIDDVHIVNMIQTEEEYENVIKEVEFDPRSYDDHDSEKIDSEYINYLIKIGSISEHEKISIKAKSLLKNCGR